MILLLVVQESVGARFLDSAGENTERLGAALAERNNAWNGGCHYA